MRDFACGWVLFALTKIAETKFKLTTLESCYIEMIENPKVNKRYYSPDLIQKLEVSIQKTTSVKVQFYLM